MAGTTVTLTADSTNPDNGKSELTATPDTIVADGADKSVLKTDPERCQRQPDHRQNVAFITDPGNVSVTPAAENTGGIDIQPSSKELRRVLWL